MKLHAVPLDDDELSRCIVNLSPFAAKLQTYLCLFGIKHELISEPLPDAGPSGKVPFISVGNTQMADSGLIINHLKHKLRDPDAHLTAEQKALVQVVQGTLEDHIYWVIIY
jgi:hypothetical protein